MISHYFMATMAVLQAVCHGVACNMQLDFDFRMACWNALGGGQAQAQAQLTVSWQSVVASYQLPVTNLQQTNGGKVNRQRTPRLVIVATLQGRSPNFLPFMGLNCLHCCCCHCTGKNYQHLF